MAEEIVDVFIDGFNLYFGLVAAQLGHCKWLDFVALAERLNVARTLGQVFYYTARVTRNQEANDRQSTYIDALRAHCGERLVIVEGRMQWEPRECDHCKRISDMRVEKHTDVNIATDMVARAYQAKYQVAMLISGDADQASAVAAVRATGREVRVVFPPERESEHLKAAASTAYPLKAKQLEDSQLPSVVHSNGRELIRPSSWSDQRRR